MTTYALEHLAPEPVTLSTHADQRAAIDAAKALATVAYYERGEKPVLWFVYLIDGRVLRITKS